MQAIKTTTNTNHNEERLIIYLHAQEQIKAINDTLDKLTTNNGKYVLINRYCKREPLTPQQLQQALFISHNALYKRINKALLEFALLYDLEDLNIYRR